MNKIIFSIIGGVLLGSVTTAWWFNAGLNGEAEPMTSAKEPLYWVAPMDPNFRRDQPGKSPMGMDLIPVYENDGKAEDAPGTFAISPQVENNLGVRTQVVNRQRLPSDIKTVGYVQYDEDRLIHIHPRVEGWVEILHIKAAGEPVRKGQALYSLYSPQLVNAQQDLLLAISRNNPRLARAAEDRLKALQMNEAFINNLKRTGQVQQAVTFHASRSGVVDNLNIREGFFVKPGTTIMSIGSLDEVWVEAEVFERQAFLVEVGQQVTMTLDYLPGRRWQGQVDYVYPVLDPSNRTVRVRLRFANPDGVLKPNMFAEVVIQSKSDSPSLVIPREAVIRTGSENRVVLALGEGRFRSVVVELGRVTDTYAEIKGGLEVGEKVVTSAQFLLDSESSKLAGFARMDHIGPAEDGTLQTAQVVGVINIIDAAGRVMNISREAIDKWNRPAATMDFRVDERVNLELFQPRDVIDFRFVIDQGQFIITRAEPVPAKMEMRPGEDQ